MTFLNGFSARATQSMLNPEMQGVHPALEGRIQLEGKDYIVISYKDWGGTIGSTS